MIPLIINIFMCLFVYFFKKFMLVTCPLISPFGFREQALKKRLALVHDSLNTALSDSGSNRRDNGEQIARLTQAHRWTPPAFRLCYRHNQSHLSPKLNPRVVLQLNCKCGTHKIASRRLLRLSCSKALSSYRQIRRKYREQVWRLEQRAAAMTESQQQSEAQKPAGEASEWRREETVLWSRSSPCARTVTRQIHPHQLNVAHSPTQFQTAICTFMTGDIKARRKLAGLLLSLTTEGGGNSWSGQKKKPNHWTILKFGFDVYCAQTKNLKDCTNPLMLLWNSDALFSLDFASLLGPVLRLYVQSPPENKESSLIRLGTHQINANEGCKHNIFLLIAC